MARRKKSVWKIVPSKDPGDQLYNRRLISYFALVYSAVWFQQVLIIIIVALVLDRTIDSAVIAALLGVPTSLAGLGVWKYLQACKRNDEQEETPNEINQSGPS